MAARREGSIPSGGTLFYICFCSRTGICAGLRTRAGLRSNAGSIPARSTWDSLQRCPVQIILCCDATTGNGPVLKTGDPFIRTGGSSPSHSVHASMPQMEDGPGSEPGGEIPMRVRLPLDAFTASSSNRSGYCPFKAKMRDRAPQRLLISLSIPLRTRTGL